MQLDSIIYNRSLELSKAKPHDTLRQLCLKREFLKKLLLNPPSPENNTNKRKNADSIVKQNGKVKKCNCNLAEMVGKQHSKISVKVISESETSGFQIQEFLKTAKIIVFRPTKERLFYTNRN